MNTTQRRVVIIGAGLAGLAAGYELMKQGWQVVILEATARVGGRVMTVRGPFANGLYAEAGAEAINAKHSFILNYAKEFHLTLKPLRILGKRSQRLSVLTAPWSVRLRLRGRVYSIPELLLNPFSFPYELKLKERLVFPLGLTDLYTRPFEKKLRDITKPLQTDLLFLDQMSFWDFLCEQGASQQANELIEEHHLFASLRELSALYMIWEQARRDFDDTFFRIEGGNSKLPEAFAASVGDVVRYESPVLRVEQHERGVSVSYLHEGREEEMHGACAICTVPLPAARRIVFDPPLSEEKSRAFEKIGYTSLLKTQVHFSRRFWEDNRWSGAGYSDQPIQYLLHTTSDQPGPGGILTSFATGTFAKTLASMGDGAITYARDLIAELDAAALTAFEGGTVKNWDDDRWAGGTHPQFNVGDMSAFWPHLGRPEGKIHFAGEHTSHWTGWMNGAVESADRVVKEITGRAYD